MRVDLLYDSENLEESWGLRSRALSEVGRGDNRGLKLFFRLVKKNPHFSFKTAIPFQFFGVPV